MTDAQITNLLQAQIIAQGRMLRNLIAVLEKRGGLTEDDVRAVISPDMFNAADRQFAGRQFSDLVRDLLATRRGEPDPDPDPRR